jgi:crossover junction endodeoxyribonuclease RuvC
LIILGVDPGSLVTGYGLLVCQNNREKVLEYGAIRTTKKNLPEKLLEIHEKLLEIIKKKKPDEFAIEETFYSKNVRAALTMGQTRGVAILAAVKAGMNIAEYSPKEVKMAITGRGNATKKQIQFMIKSLLNLKELPHPEDASDALAIALCHAQKIKTRELLKKYK